MRPKDRLLRRGIPKTAIHSGLEGWSDQLSKWERGWTAIVVLGLAFEVIATLSRFLPHDWYESIRPHLPMLSDFGTAIVFVGVLGELVVSSKSGRVETDLRQENESIISNTRDRAEKAEQAAAEANLQRIRLERELTPRCLTKYDFEIIKRELSKFSGQAINIRVFAPGEEAVLFAHDISVALSRAGWNVNLMKPEVTSDDSGGSGFSVVTTPDTRSMEAGERLVRVLLSASRRTISASISAYGSLKTDLHLPRIEIYIMEQPMLSRPPSGLWETAE